MTSHQKMPPITPPDRMTSTASERLRQAQVRVTDARVEVLTMLLENTHALSHTDLQNALPHLDRVTLYRALDCLSDAGLTHKITGGDRVFRFSTGNDAHHETAAKPNSTQHQHSHFTCTRCTKVFCLNDHDNVNTPLPSLNTQLQPTLAAIASKGFRHQDIEVTIKGWCNTCAHLKQ